ncbi:hypothetical protein KI387_041617, partial [Taxus chinensis]
IWIAKYVQRIKQKERMASSNRPPHGLMPSTTEDVPGKPFTIGINIIDKGAKILQTMSPIKQFQQ